MKRLIIEGWRHSLTSYSVLNQFQCLELLKRPGLELYHRDMPFHIPEWRSTPGLLPQDKEARMAAIPQPPPGLNADAVYRMVHPVMTRPSPDAARTLVWAVTEFKIMEDSRIDGGITARQAFSNPDLRLVTCSNWSKLGLVRSGADPAHISVVPGGVDPEIYHPPTASSRDAERLKRGWEGKFVVLNVSTLVWSKGVGAMLQVFARFAQRFPDAILAIKGSSELLKSEKRLNDFLAVCPPDLVAFLKPRLHYIGDDLSFDDLASIYGAADVYFAPYHAEGFNLPVLEAAACGLPVVVTQGGPTDDFTDPSFCLPIRSREVSHPHIQQHHGRDALLLVIDGDHGIEQLTRSATDHAYRAAARTAGPAFVRAGFTWDKVVDQMLAVVFP